jgi:cytosine/uracil/thiamine/allantoin permease
MVQLLRLLGHWELEHRKLANAQHILEYAITLSLQMLCLGLMQSAMGLSVPQAMVVIVVGRLLIAGFSTLVAWAGLKWHIGFTVQNRYTWGMKGSYIPLLQRILLNFIWNAVQCRDFILYIFCV